MTQQEHRTPDQQGQTIIINQPTGQTNGMGITGFVLAIIALFLGWIPVLGWIIWLLGLIFSVVGVFKKPKGLAIAGIVISLIGVFFLLVVFSAIVGTGLLYGGPGF